MAEINSYPNIRRIAEATHDVVTPANAITAAGLALSIYGATHIYELSGVLEFGAGRMLDVADGFVARRTYASRTGAKADAVADKIAVGAVVAEALHQKAAPVAALAVIAAYNIVNSVANVYAEKKGAIPDTSRYGKIGMATQNAALGALLLGNALQNGSWEATGWSALAASTPIATKASYEYAKQALQVRKASKLPDNVRLIKQHQRERR